MKLSREVIQEKSRRPSGIDNVLDNQNMSVRDVGQFQIRRLYVTGALCGAAVARKANELHLKWVFCLDVPHQVGEKTKCTFHDSNDDWVFQIFVVLANNLAKLFNSLLNLVWAIDLGDSVSCLFARNHVRTHNDEKAQILTGSGRQVYLKSAQIKRTKIASLHRMTELRRFLSTINFLASHERRFHHAIVSKKNKG